MEHEVTIKKVLLGLMPFWTPSIPPLGISSLKAHLQQRGFTVTTVDANMMELFRQSYDRYFDLVQQGVPKYKRGNFFNIGMDVMRNHMMAHVNHTDRNEYIELVKIIFYKTFYCPVSSEQVEQLNLVLDEFYRNLEEYITGLIERVQPDMFGLSVFSGSLPASLFAFKVAKRIKPGMLTVMGGGTFSMELGEGTPNFEYVLNTMPFIDKFMIGEGENLLLAFLEGKLTPGQKVYTLRDVVKEKFEVSQALLPDFSDFNLTAYPQLGAWSSRSCPFQCSFCSETVHWGSYRKKPAVKIVNELTTLHEQYNVRVFMMGDSLLNVVISGLAEEFLRRDKILYWDGYLRTDPPVCDTANTLLWRQGGMYRARLGVESGSQKILDIMHKKITVDQIRRAVKSLAAVGIKTTTYWIIGHPGETEEDFQMTLDLIEELKDDLWEAECNPFSYYLTGQVDSEKWMAEYKRVTLYPENAQSMLVTQTWILKDCEPVREVVYDRVNRFVDHCRKLKIPNPYFEHEIFEADERWKRLHKNAVPALVDFRNNLVTDESRAIRLPQQTSLMDLDKGEFAF